MEHDTEVISSFFCNEPCSQSNSIHEEQQSSDTADIFLNIIDELNISLERLILPSAVACVYNPTIYARHTLEMYVRKYCNSKKPIMYFGMNPGPWGMSQTGIPFGEVSSVRDWLKITGPVGKPPKEIVARPVKGFECTRTEVSGKRFWGLWQEICGTPDKFFSTSFVYNYIPQQWMKNNGCNLTPGDFRQYEMEEVFKICDPVFVKVLELYGVEKIVAVGKFCQTRAQKALNKYISSNKIQAIAMENKYMERALELANEALISQEVPVGCVFVYNNNIIAESRNSVNITHNPTRHAEINCIDTVVEYCRTNKFDFKDYFKNISVYVTVEPCIMCAAALHNLKVKEVVYGCANDRFGGKTVLDVSKYYDFNYASTGNVVGDEAMALLKQFYKGCNPNSPDCKAKKL